MACKQRRRDVFLFEDLPNEIFVELLSYLPALDAFTAFNNLNYRFQRLMLEFCRSFDLTFIRTSLFDIILQCYDTNRWYSLKLSNEQKTPGQLKYFFQNYSLTNRFSQLQSLSIVGMNSIDQHQVFSQLPSLTNLVSLRLESICGEAVPALNLPRLKTLIFTSCTNTNWLQHLPQIETIEYTIKDHQLHGTILMWPRTLKQLTISFTTDNDCALIQQSFSHLPQLIHLEIYQKERGILFPNGQIWEQIILSSFPSLKKFQFYFQFNCQDSQLNQMKQIMASFSSSFYVHDKQWFTRCDVSARPIAFDRRNRNWKFVVIYTIPFPFETLTIFKTSAKITNSNLSKNSIDYRRSTMKTLVFQSYTKPGEYLSGNNLMNLVINSSFDSRDWIHRLTTLRHLTLEDSALLSMEDLNTLLDHTPYLSSLTARKSMLKQLTDNWTDICICNHLSRKIRSLTFPSHRDSVQCFNKNELEKILPIFASKCQHLSLGVHSRNNAIDFILRKMCQLNSLHILIHQRKSPPITIEWIEQQHTRFNHSNCIITSDKQDHYFWLR